MAGLLIISIVFAQASSGIALEPADYPTSASAYEQGAVVKIDTTTLDALHDGQLHALLQYARSCGRVLLLDVSPGIVEALRNDAACDGRYLSVATPADDANARSLELEELPDPARADSADLYALLDALSDDSLNVRNLALFWFAYLLLAGALLLNGRTRIAGLVFSAVTSLLVPVLWPSPDTHTFVAWAEAEEDDRVAAFFSIERDRADGQGGFLSSVTERRGSFGVSPGLGFSFDKQAIRICNLGDGKSKTSHVYWRGEVFAMPLLDSGESWESQGEPGLDSERLTTPELELFLQRSARHELTLLRELPVSDAEGHGWLLQYVTPEQDIRSCAS